MTGEGDGDPAVATALQEARRTMDNQAEVFDDIQKKAIKLMKYTVSLASLLGTVITLLKSSEALHSYGGLVNGFTVGSVALLALAALVSGFAYTLTTQINGLSPSGIREGASTDDAEYQRRLLSGYADWIDQNRRLNHRADALVSLTILLVVTALVAFATGITDTLVVDLPPWAALVDIAIFAVTGYVSGVFHRLYHISADYGGGALNPVLGGRKNGKLPHSPNKTRERLRELTSDD